VYVPYFLMRFGLGNGHFDFFSCQLLASSLPNWARGVSFFRWGWCMGRGPMLRETCLGLRYIILSFTISELYVFGTWSVLREICLDLMYNTASCTKSENCVFLGRGPYDESHSLFSRKLRV